MTKFISTNKTKYLELKKYDSKLIHHLPKEDVPEVNGSPLEIIIHKTKDLVNKFNLNDCIVEDSTFEVWDSENRLWIPIIDVKFCYHELKEKVNIRWVSHLAHYKSKKITVFKESVLGQINWNGKESFYDTFIINNKFVSDHIKENNEDKFCSRTKAYLRYLKNDLADYILFTSDISDWTGEYQKE